MIHVIIVDFITPTKKKCETKRCVSSFVPTDGSIGKQNLKNIEHVMRPQSNSNEI